jgi:lysophospholipase L1-like esterase
LVLLGANDAALPIPTNTQGIPIEQYKHNLTKIVTHDLIKTHNPKILLVTPPPLDEIRLTELDLAKGHKTATRKASVSAAYSETAREVASEVPGVILIDLHRAILDKAISLSTDFDPSGPPLGYAEGGKRGALEQLVPDGLHLSGQAYEIFFDLVKPHFDALPKWPYPEWQALHPGSM